MNLAPSDAVDTASTFAALDFETADCAPDSACALGIVTVERSRIVRRRRWLIRPPRSEFEFTHIHGLTWPMVAGVRAARDCPGPREALSDAEACARIVLAAGGGG